MAPTGKIKNLAKYRLFFVLFLLTALLSVSSLTTLAATAEKETAAVDKGNDISGKVTVTYKGRTTPIAVSGTTNVDNVLRRMSITLGAMDVVTPELTQRVAAGDAIKVVTKEIISQEVTGPVPFETVHLYSEDNPVGEEIVLVEGEDGYGTRVFERVLEDGVVVKETLLKEEYTKTPVNQEVSMGFRMKPISQLDFEWAFGEEGEPLEPVAVFRNQRTTAYSARPNSLTASGRAAMVGHVAVNPNNIPYGSKLFIQATDGKDMIYGYAVAADTGTALLDGRSNLDLYFDTYAESVDHGVKYMDIFVLEHPTAE